MDIVLKKHAIVYIDLLGTKEKIKSDTDGQVLSMLHNVYHQAIKAFTQDIKEEQIKMKIFSDNIIIAREVPSEEDLSFLINQMIGVAACFQFLLLGSGWPSRGGLTLGDLYMDETFVWGSGLVRAYELESKIAVFPRIVIDPNMMEIIKKPSVHAWRYDGGLPIVDVFDVIQNGGTLEQTALLMKKSILNIYKNRNESTIGKIEWIINEFNQWCTKSDNEIFHIGNNEKNR